MSALSERYSDALVQRVNELYHDLDHDSYDNTHPEIFACERERWLRLAGDWLRSERPLTIADIGTGTGFVPRTICGLLKAGDQLWCTDVSQGMLDTARAALEKAPPACTLHFLKLELQVPMRLPFEDGSLDVVTMNSVLHHIKDTENFLAEVTRVLKPRGLFFVAHEPNAYFAENRLLKANAALLARVLDPKIAAFDVLEALRVSGPAKSIYYRLRPAAASRIAELQTITDQINRTLFEEGMITAPLAVTELGHITDIALAGFRPDRLIPSFELVACETYHHLSDASVDARGRSLFGRYDAWLQKRYPLDGRDFFAILRKP